MLIVHINLFNIQDTAAWDQLYKKNVRKPIFWCRSSECLPHATISSAFRPFRPPALLVTVLPQLFPIFGSSKNSYYSGYIIFFFLEDSERIRNLLSAIRLICLCIGNIGNRWKEWKICIMLIVSACTQPCICSMQCSVRSYDFVRCIPKRGHSKINTISIVSWWLRLYTCTHIFLIVPKTDSNKKTKEEKTFIRSTHELYRMNPIIIYSQNVWMCTCSGFVHSNGFLGISDRTFDFNRLVGFLTLFRVRCHAAITIRKNCYFLYQFPQCSSCIALDVLSDC